LIDPGTNALLMLDGSAPSAKADDLTSDKGCWKGDGMTADRIKSTDELAEPPVLCPMQRKPPAGYCFLTVLSLAASFARSACQASYSGVPRRGGTSFGIPPAHCGMASEIVAETLEAVP